MLEVLEAPEALEALEVAKGVELQVVGHQIPALEVSTNTNSILKLTVCLLSRINSRPSTSSSSKLRQL